MRTKQTADSQRPVKKPSTWQESRPGDERDIKRSKEMKEKALTTIAITIFLTLVSTTKTSAQSVNQQFIAEIPFSFTVENDTLPAGTYRLVVVNPSSDQKVVRISNVEGNRNLMVRMSTVIASENADSRLVFRRYGDHHFLAQAWAGGDSYGLETRKSKSERSIGKDLAANGHRVETETLALKRR